MLLTMTTVAVLSAIPPAYVEVAKQQQIPPAVFWCLCLQESGAGTGANAQHNILPWPWTLNIQGKAYRFDRQSTAQQALQTAINSGIKNIDVGIGQLNYRWHGHRFNAISDMLDPVRNIATAATVLREQARHSEHWFEAVGKYHAPNHARRAKAYARRVMARCQQWRKRGG